MTREEIKKQKDAVEVLDYLLHEFEKKATPRLGFKRIRWALGYAIECVKKQMPKKVVYHDDSGNKTVSERCPICFEIAHSDYCEYCGQALDWTEEGE